MRNWKCRISAVCLIWVFALTGCQSSLIVEQKDVCASWQMDADGSVVLTFQLFDEEEATEINLGFPEELGNMDDFRNAYQAAMDYDMEQGKLLSVR